MNECNCQNVIECAHDGDDGVIPNYVDSRHFMKNVHKVGRILAFYIFDVQAILFNRSNGLQAHRVVLGKIVSVTVKVSTVELYEVLQINGIPTGTSKR